MDSNQHGAARPARPNRPMQVPTHAAWSFLLLTLLYGLPPLWAWIGKLLRLYRTGMLTTSTLGLYVRIDDPPELLLSAWPIVLACLLVRTRWPQLLMPSGVCLLASGLSDLIQAGLSIVTLYPTSPFWRAFRLDRTSILTFLMIRGVLALVAGFGLWQVRSAWKRASKPVKGIGSQPPEIAGRLTFLLSGILLLAFSGVIAWNFLTHVGLRDPRIRGLLAGPSNTQNSAGRTVPMDPAVQRLNAALDDLNQADMLVARGKSAEARTLFTKALNVFSEQAKEEELTSWMQTIRARGLNNLAWLLCTCEERGLRNQEMAVSLARLATEQAPKEGNYWNTLGVALLEAGEWNNAREALEKAMLLQEGGGPHDWLFLAQIEQKVGHPTEARRFYDRSEESLLKRGTRDPELKRFYAETAEALGLPAKELPKPTRNQGDTPPAIMR